MRHCDCSLCLRVSSKGMSLKDATYYRHQEDERNRQRAAEETEQQCSPPKSKSPAIHMQRNNTNITHLAESLNNLQLHPTYVEGLREIQTIRSLFLQVKLSLHIPFDLYFIQHPSMFPSSAAYSPRKRDESISNTGSHALDRKSPLNEHFLDREDNLYSLMRELRSNTSDYPEIESQKAILLDEISSSLDLLDEWKEQTWTHQRQTDAQARSRFVVETAPYFLRPDITWNPMILACHLVVLIMNLTCRLPHRACELLLAGLRGIVRLATLTQPEYQGAMFAIPKKLRTVLLAFDIEPRTRSYICCPKCFALYEEVRPYMPVCSNKEAHDSPQCGERLIRKRSVRGSEYLIPIKKYLHQDMKEWVGRFLSRPGIEDLMVDTANNALHKEDTVLEDILESEAVKGFLGHDKQPFFRAVTGESRYLFSLSVDGFNPFRNIQAKLKASSTGIYLVCLSLPPGLRHRPENIYLVGVIPGPNKPSLSEMNHSLDILVDDLLDFWDPGVYYTRTAKYNEGRRVRIVIIPVVCDALAARQVVGFGSIRSTFFCTLCYLTLQDIENMEKSTWPKRNAATHRQYAEAWRDSDVKNRLEIFQMTGIRWSALLRLPYFDPIRFTVLDIMHNLYLGLLQRHCRKIWGMSIDQEDGDGMTRHEQEPEAPSAEKLETARVALERGRWSSLERCTRPALWFLCEELGLRRPGTKAKLIKVLKEWRMSYLGSNPTSSTVSIPRPVVASNPYEGSGTPSNPSNNISTRALELMAKAESNLVLGHSLQRYNRNILEGLCKTRALSTAGNKADLMDRLEAWRTKQPTSQPNTLEMPVQSDENRNSGAVLGRSTLTEAHEDSADIELPSWVNHVPSKYGTTMRGKLSADQWRTLCSINLPITLIRLWGSPDAKPRHRQMLDNFMDLVTAVEIGSTLAIGPSHIKIYKECITRYVKSLIELYSESVIVSNHHLALHFDDFLPFFGPSHAWRAFTLERVNYLLQQTNTNRRLDGSVEISYMNTFCRSANIATLLSDKATKELVSELYDAYGGYLNYDTRGTRINDILSLQAKEQEIGETAKKPVKIKIPESTFVGLMSVLNAEMLSTTYISWPNQKRTGQIFLSQEAELCNRIAIRGLRYQPHRVSPKNSNVMFSLHPEKIEAGKIVDMFLHTRKLPDGLQQRETFLVINRLFQLSENNKAHDPYLHYPQFGGRLYDVKYSDEPVIVRPSSVVCHFAKLVTAKFPFIQERCVIVVPLDRLKNHILREEIEAELGGTDEDIEI